jgi:segregation and condensation protein A
MSERFTYQAETFAGPLESLLDMVEARKMSISEISLSEVCDAYLSYVEKLPELPLGETAQFILVASTLLLIKSRTLLPNLELTLDERESVQELERRLALYALVRKATKLLRAKGSESSLLLARRAPIRPIVFSPGETTLTTIRSAVERILRSIPKPETLSQAVVAPVVALEDVIKDLHSRIRSAIRTRWSDLTRNTKDKPGLIVHFLAILELVRNGSASVTQDALFSDIAIEIENVSGAPRYGV